MSNGQLTLVTLVALVAHVLALTIAIWLRRAQPAIVVNLAVAGLTLIVLASNLRWLRAPVDLPVVGLAAVEVLIVVLAMLALARHQAAIVSSWVAFGVHFLASGLAVAFALTFRITRLI
jgi:hypothetical protein